MHATTQQKSTMLQEAWGGIQQAKPGIRIREAAMELGVSEAELLATKIGQSVIRLQGPWPELLESFKTLGRVMSLTRNDSCILEHKGSFQRVDIVKGPHPMATVIGPIETRVFFGAWHFAFAAMEEKSNRVLKSIQVFDKSGHAITKIYLQEKSIESAYDSIVHNFKAPDQTPELCVLPYPEEQFSTSIDTADFLTDWSNLKDTHDFFGLLRKHKVQRYHALELAAQTFTRQVDPQQAPHYILEKASASKLPIMIFAGNRGNLQIHQGKVRTIRVLDRGHTGQERWLNVLDPDFNMHLKQNDVDTCWVVRKPTTDGEVTSVECFDRNRNLIVQFFGLRKPGIQELAGWKNLVHELPA